MAKSSSNNDADIDKFLQLGMKLSVSLQFGPGDKYDFTSTLTGYKSAQYLILDLPNKALELLIMRKINNVETVIRGICSRDYGHIIAFKTSSFQSIRRPFNLLFLRPPQHFASKKIREHERYQFEIPATVKSSDKELTGTMVDFSASGCGVFISGENELSPGLTVHIESELSRLIPKELTCNIVKITRETKGHLIGIKFDNTITMSDELRKEVLEQAFHAGSI